MTFIPADQREGHVECDHPLCQATSSTFVAQLGGDLPDGWVVSDRFGPAEGGGTSVPRTRI
jgi:hypothetical protein